MHILYTVDRVRLFTGSGLYGFTPILGLKRGVRLYVAYYSMFNPPRFLRTACPTCWLLDVSRLIASRMVFRAQGESLASCARDRGLNLAAPMLQRGPAKSAANRNTY